jgi:hypothetical protein
MIGCRSSDLRRRTEEVAEAVRLMLAASALPPPLADSGRCDGCSLAEACRPEVVRRAAARPVHLWLETALNRLLAEQGDEDGG